VRDDQPGFFNTLLQLKFLTVVGLNLHPLFFGIDDPALLDAEIFIELFLFDQINIAGGGRADSDYQIGHAVNALFSDYVNFRR
jgi:hypothetical protein